MDSGLLLSKLSLKYAKYNNKPLLNPRRRRRKKKYQSISDLFEQTATIYLSFNSQTQTIYINRV